GARVVHRPDRQVSLGAAVRARDAGPGFSDRNRAGAQSRLSRASRRTSTCRAPSGDRTRDRSRRPPPRHRPAARARTIGRAGLLPPALQRRPPRPPAEYTTRGPDPERPLARPRPNRGAQAPTQLTGRRARGRNRIIRMGDTVEDLQRVPLFADLDRRQLNKLAERFRERILPPGATPVQEGTMSGIGFFVVADGEAAVS